MKIIVTVEIPEPILAVELEKSGMTREQFIELGKAGFSAQSMEGMPEGTTATVYIE